jgi:hypothetical protein
MLTDFLTHMGFWDLVGLAYVFFMTIWLCIHRYA